MRSAVLCLRFFVPASAINHGGISMSLDDLELLSTRATSDATGLPQSTMLKMSTEGTFPAPVEIPGSRRLGFRKAEIRDWLADLKHRERPAVA